MDIFLSYCGLVDARISTSEKDLPVPVTPVDTSLHWRIVLIEIAHHRSYLQWIRPSSHTYITWIRDERDRDKAGCLFLT